MLVDHHDEDTSIQRGLDKSRCGRYQRFNPTEQADVENQSDAGESPGPLAPEDHMSDVVLSVVLQSKQYGHICRDWWLRTKEAILDSDHNLNTEIPMMFSFRDINGKIVEHNHDVSNRMAVLDKLMGSYGEANDIK